MRQTLRSWVDWICDFWAEAAQACLAVVILLSATLISDEGFDTAYSNIVTDYEPSHQAAKMYKQRKAIAQTICFRLLLAAGAMELCLAVYKWRKSLRISVLEGKIDQISSENEVLVNNIQNLLEGYLLNFALYRLNFGGDGPNSERITLYAHDESEDCFVPAARYSHNPHFKSVGRPKYPDDEGCIGDAWKNGTDFLTINHSPETATVRYRAAHERKGLTEETIESLRMQSRLYFGHRIDSPENRPLAVLIIESTEVDRFAEDDLVSLMEEELKRNLSELVTKLLPHLSLPSDASERGF